MSKGKQISVAKYLENQIDLSDLSQKDIAAAVGYENPNVITMIKQGKTKLPVNKVGPFAKALGIDPVHLLRLVMTEYMPDTYSALAELIGQSLVSEGEMRVIQLVREHSGGHDISLANDEHRDRLAKTIREIVAEENPTRIVKKK